MSEFKTKKIVSIAALALCLALAATFVLAFAGCEEEDASADNDTVPGLITDGRGGWSYTSEIMYYDDGFVSAPYYIFASHTGGSNNFIQVYAHFAEWPETTNSEIVETAYVENDKVTRTSEFDKNGVATCTYTEVEGSVPEEFYLTLGGGLYRFYPYSYTLAPIETTAETPEIQVSFIFKEKPTRRGKYFSSSPRYVEISSPTGKSLDPDEMNVRAESEVFYFAYTEYDESGLQEIGTSVGAEPSGLISAALNTSDADAIVFGEVNLTRDNFFGDALPGALPDTVGVPLECEIPIHSYSLLRIGFENGDTYYYGFSTVPEEWLDLMPDADTD